MFTIPTDLSVFSVAGLKDLLRVATAELAELRAGLTDYAFATDEQAQRIADLHAFGVAAKAQIEKAEKKAADIAAADPSAFEAAFQLAQAVVAETPAEPVVETPAEPVVETVTASTEVARPNVAAVAAAQDSNPVITGEVVVTNPGGWLGSQHTMVAANNLPGVTDGSEMGSWF